MVDFTYILTSKIMVVDNLIPFHNARHNKVNGSDSSTLNSNSSLQDVPIIHSTVFYVFVA